MTFKINLFVPSLIRWMGQFDKALRPSIVSTAITITRKRPGWFSCAFSTSSIQYTIDGRAGRQIISSYITEILTLAEQAQFRNGFKIHNAAVSSTVVLMKENNAFTAITSAQR
jgi:hypothetical protein